MKTVIFLLLFATGLTYGQTSYSFTYDTAGNQTEATKYLYVQGNQDFLGKNSQPAIRVDLEESITYFPNPVKDQLYLKWENTNSEHIKSISLYNMIGTFLKKYESMEYLSEYNISFSEYPTGNYIISFHYSSGDEKSIKIIKN